MGRKLTLLLQIPEAVEITAKKIRIGLEEERIRILDALNRIASRDIISEYNIPFFDRSAVDGYAVRAEDTYGASESNPIILKVIGDARSLPSEVTVKQGEAVRIFTGDPLPQGTNAVVMLEDVIEDGDRIYVLKSLSRYANVSLHSEDIYRGKVLIKRGELIEPKHLAALATVGINEVEVYRKIRICVLCTGSEVVEPGTVDTKTVLEKGLTFNSTGIFITSFLKSLGFVEPIYMGIVSDVKNEIISLLRKAMELCHVVITTGGAGPSERDLIIDVVEYMGGELVVRGIAMRPGRPTSAGIINGKPIFMLSGFPVAAFLGLRYFVLPSLEKALKISIPRKIVIARLLKRVTNVVGYTTFARVKIYKCSEHLCAEPIALTGSGTISTILDSNGVLIVPPDVEGFDKDQFVEIELF